MREIAISVENLSKRYLVGHQSDQYRTYTTLRDVIAREARNFLTFQVKPEKKATIAAAVHVDGSARVQSVTRDQNERYYDLIKSFAAKRGVPAVLTTSFNLKGEPIVNSPIDAIRTFYTSGLDVLILDRYLITNNR